VKPAAATIESSILMRIAVLRCEPGYGLDFEVANLGMKEPRWIYASGGVLDFKFL
jgi:hypothetical protein